MSADPRPFPIVPPFLFALSLLAGLGLHWLIGWPPRWGGLGWHLWLGGAIFVLALGFGFSQVRGLRRRGTTVNPAGAPSFLIETGPYRRSRNPIYLALTAAYLGATLALGSLWVLAFLAVPLWLLDRRIIPFEEAQLETAFGDAYRRYRDRVPRWL